MTNDNDSAASQPGQIVPQAAYGSGMNPRVMAAAGYAWCAAGGLVTGLLGVFGSFCVAYGCCLLAGVRGRRDALLGTLLAVAVGAVGVVLGVGDSYTEAVVYSAVGAAMGLLFGLGTATSGRVCLACVAATLAFLAGDVVGLALQGTTVSAYMSDVLSSLRTQLAAMGGASIDETAAYQTVFSLLGVLWPSAYTLLAFGACLCGAVGGRAALRRLRQPALVAPFRQFDLPLWAVWLLAGGVAGMAVAGALPAGGDAVRMVAANVLVGVRVLLAVQGFAVLAWWTVSRRMGPAASALVVVIALVLDAQFFVMAVVGLIDVWANFRHLPRGGAPAADAPGGSGASRPLR